MELNELFYQNYWWFLISLLGALLVFLLFVQGGQSLLAVMGKTETEKSMMVNSLGRKWEFTFTTLVVFGGAFFASFPLFLQVQGFLRYPLLQRFLSLDPETHVQGM